MIPSLISKALEQYVAPSLSYYNFSRVLPLYKNRYEAGANPEFAALYDDGIGHASAWGAEASSIQAGDRVTLNPAYVFEAEDGSVRTVVDGNMLYAKGPEAERLVSTHIAVPREVAFYPPVGNPLDIADPMTLSWARSGIPTPFSIAGACVVLKQHTTIAMLEVASEEDGGDPTQWIQVGTEQTGSLSVISMAELRREPRTLNNVAQFLGIPMYVLLGQSSMTMFHGVIEITRTDILGGMTTEFSTTIGVDDGSGGVMGSPTNSNYASLMDAYMADKPGFKGFDPFGYPVHESDFVVPAGMALAFREGSQSAVFFFGARYVAAKVGEFLATLAEQGTPEERLEARKAINESDKLAENYGYFLRVRLSPVDGPDNVWRQIRQTESVADTEEFLNEQVFDNQRAKDVRARIKNTTASIWAWAAYSRNDTVTVTASSASDSLTYKGADGKFISYDDAIDDIYAGATLVVAFWPDEITQPQSWVIVNRLIDIDAATADSPGRAGIDVRSFADEPTGWEWVMSYGRSGFSDTPKALIQVLRAYMTPVSDADLSLLHRDKTRGWLAHGQPVAPDPEPEVPTPGGSEITSSFSGTGYAFALPVVRYIDDVAGPSWSDGFEVQVTNGQSSNFGEVGLSGWSVRVDSSNPDLFYLVFTSDGQSTLRSGLTAMRAALSAVGGDTMSLSPAFRAYQSVPRAWVDDPLLAKWTQPLNRLIIPGYLDQAIQGYFGLVDDEFPPIDLGGGKQVMEVIWTMMNGSGDSLTAIGSVVIRENGTDTIRPIIASA